MLKLGKYSFELQETCGWVSFALPIDSLRGIFGRTEVFSEICFDFLRVRNKSWIKSGANYYRKRVLQHFLSFPICQELFLVLKRILLLMQSLNILPRHFHNSVSQYYFIANIHISVSDPKWSIQAVRPFLFNFQQKTSRRKKIKLFHKKST